MVQSQILICFAVKEEGEFLDRKSSGILITGMGQRNASEKLRNALASVQPESVLTCGFAGGLNPKLPLGAIVFDEDAGMGISAGLLKSGALAAQFHCAT